jgi:hypothetical protein
MLSVVVHRPVAGSYSTRVLRCMSHPVPFPPPATSTFPEASSVAGDESADGHAVGFSPIPLAGSYSSALLKEPSNIIMSPRHQHLA